MELGDPKIRCRPTMVAELSRIYGAEEDAPVRWPRRPSWFQAGSRFDPYSGVLPAGLARCVDVEPCATAIRAYGPDVLPSLLQTGRYAGATGGVGSEVWARIQRTRLDSMEENGTNCIRSTSSASGPLCR